MDNFLFGGAKTWEKNQEHIKKWEDVLIHATEDFPNMTEGLAKGIDKLMDGFDKLLPSMEAFGGSVYDGILKPIGGLLMSNETGTLIQAIIDMGTTIVTELKPVMEVVAGSLKDIFYDLGEIVGGVASFDENWHRGMFSMFSGGKFETVQDEKQKKRGYYILHDDQEPNWAITMQPDDQAKLVKYVADYWGGNLKPWMNSPKQSKYYQKHNAFDLSDDALGGYNDDVNPQGKKSKADLSASNEAVVSGGQRVVNINLQSLIHTFNQHVANAKEGTGEMVDITTRALRSVLAGVVNA